MELLTCDFPVMFFLNIYLCSGTVTRFILITPLGFSVSVYGTEIVASVFLWLAYAAAGYLTLILKLVLVHISDYDLRSCRLFTDKFYP